MAEVARKAALGVVAAGAVLVAYSIYQKRKQKFASASSSGAVASVAVAPESGLRPLVVCGPSGVGKGTLLDMLMKEFPGVFAKCVSHTTRQPRKGEEHGNHYFFSTIEAMRKAIGEGKFIESAEVAGNIYGTSVAAVDDVAKKGHICILEIDVQGAELVRKTHLSPLYLFIKPPTFESLETRLRGRNSETEETLKKRLDTAKRELLYMDTCQFVDHAIVNAELSRAYQELRAFVISTYPTLEK